MRRKYPSFTMSVHFRDTDTFFKERFSLKVLAFEWFEAFKQTNKRPVTITFYTDVVPNWVYRKDP